MLTIVTLARVADAETRSTPGIRRTLRSMRISQLRHVIPAIGTTVVTCASASVRVLFVRVDFGIGTPAASAHGPHRTGAGQAGTKEVSAGAVRSP